MLPDIDTQQPYEPSPDRPDLQAALTALRADGATVVYWIVAPPGHPRRDAKFCVLIEHEAERRWLATGDHEDVAFERALAAKNVAE